MSIHICINSSHHLSSALWSNTLKPCGNFLLLTQPDLITSKWWPWNCYHIFFKMLSFESFNLWQGKMLKHVHIQHEIHTRESSSKIVIFSSDSLPKTTFVAATSHGWVFPPCLDRQADASQASSRWSFLLLLMTGQTPPPLTYPHP